MTELVKRDNRAAIYACECIVSESLAELMKLCDGRQVWDGPFERTLPVRHGYTVTPIKQWYAYVDPRNH